MAESMGTPGSNADTSVNGGKMTASKDKACPFCHQQFTSSSLGRHLDLYIKEKNPKPADGIHNVEEIRKMRGGITRRQPRNSMSRREGSTPGGTPGAGRPSPGNSDVDMSGNRSPSMRRDGPEGSDGIYTGKPRFIINGATWEATGVMNNIPSSGRNGESARSWDGDEGRRLDGRSRSVSRQMLAKTTFEQKQKMIDALDNAKAAELALRELMGSIRAAKLRRIEASSIFDFDPFVLDFPALTLHCLPPPPTLHTSTPIATSSSWSIAPPNEQQYEALRTYFAAQFHRWRVGCAVASTVPTDDLSYPPASFFVEPVDPVEVAQRAESDATELEGKLAEHLRVMFTHWSKLLPAKRTELWTLELARSIGRKSDEITKIKTEGELKEQENVHLKMQVDELSRLQHPREFRIAPPATYPFEKKVIADMSEAGLKWTGIGFTLEDRNMPLDTIIERAIGRWKEVVREARGGGMAAQRMLSGETPRPTAQQATPQQQPGPQQTPQQHNSNAGPTSAESIGSDADADADADMDEDTSYVEMTTETSLLRAPEAQMANSNNTAQDANTSSNNTNNNNSNYRLTNGHSASGQTPPQTQQNSAQQQVQNQQNLERITASGLHIDGLKGTEKQSCVAGYLRVGV